MKVPLYSKAGKKGKDVELNATLFGSRVNQRLLDLVTKAYAANLRRGTAHTKERKEVRGGGKKPWRQKGTGRARAGSSRSPIWRGGGTTFGPRTRSYFVRLSALMKKKALVSALSLKAKENKVVLLEDARLEKAKTREWAGVVEALPLNGKRAVCIVKDLDENLKRASSNLLNRVDVRAASDVNAYHVMQRDTLIIEEAAIAVLEQAVAVRRVRTKKAGKPAAGVGS